MYYAKDQGSLVFDAVHNNVFSYGETSVSRAEVVLPRTSYVGKPSKREETVRDGVDQAVGNLDASAFLGNV